ncbi:SidA/IucD/PvdA family monooxygenase [Bradyrhizobium sp. CCGB12]|uniref:lysine N(6)-hydroxylase/L-ornithine N(5)-oxygenase family protein n=1 Tax=Bradyrhizobium sp. CCGB12 TaxID=2949632 RepID=UPI0020B36011|nr:SidA/IucD/PvdA family monooxygenase [Bradyrhizobium sp. CCGB12]MCP3392205.1 SidA/IucD/PvdA family monooxygenase [Bradyrhizobium sp. CCGB12]
MAPCRDDATLAHSDSHDVIAIGAGPANLSLAALSAPIPELSLRILERSGSVNWHSGLLVGGAVMQTSPLKDLVTPADPTSAYSFLAYLHEKRRLYQAIARGLEHVSRREFGDYLRWVAEKLANIQFGEQVVAVELRGKSFNITTSCRQYQTPTAVLGVGRMPFIPDWGRNAPPNEVFHASTLLAQRRELSSKRVVVVGGGQSGAEVFLHLLRGACGALRSLTWATRRANILALEDSPFVNEWFFPQYGGWFFEQGKAARKHLLERQLLASDGVNPSTLRAIYNALYNRELDQGSHPAHVGIRVDTTAYKLSGASPFLLGLRQQMTGICSEHVTDIVVLATGYRTEVPSFLEPIANRLMVVSAPGGSQEIVVGKDFSARFDGPEECRLYVQNGARFQHGIADTNLSLTPWRASAVLNSILGRIAYDCGPARGAVDWYCSGFEGSRSSEKKSAAPPGPACVD